MSFSKTLFLSSLTCFSLGLGSAFADSCVSGCQSGYCVGSCCEIALTVDGIEVSVDSGSTSPGTSFNNAINCLNAGNPGPIIFFVSETGTPSSSLPDITTSGDIISLIGTALTTGNIVTYVTIDALSTDVVTFGSTTSGYSGTTYPISFDFVYATGIDVSSGTLVFGPQVTYPTTTSELFKINVNGVDSTLELQIADDSSETIGSFLIFDEGNLYVSGSGVTLTVTSGLEFSNGCTLSGDSSDSTLSFTNTSNEDLLWDELTISDITFETATYSYSGGTIIMGTDSVLTPIGTLTFPAGDQPQLIALLGGGNTIIAPSDETFTIEGVISENTVGSVLTVGALGSTGTVIFSGDNTYSGGTSFLGGTLSIGSKGNLGTGVLTISDGATLEVTGSTNIAGISVDSNLDLSLPGSSTLTISGDLTGTSDSFGFTAASDTATLIFEGSASTIDATFTFTSVDFQLGSSAALSSTCAIALGNNTFDLSSITGDVSIGNLSAGGGAITLGTGDLIVYQTVSQVTNGVISSTISGLGGMNYQNGNSAPTSNVVIGPTGTNTYTGNTTVGPYVTLEVSAVDNIGGGSYPLVMQGPSQVSINTDLTLSNASALEISGDTCTLDLGNNVALSITGVVSGSAPLYLSSSSPDSTVSFTSTANNYTGAMTLDNVTLLVTSPSVFGGTPSITFIGGILSIEDTLTFPKSMVMSSSGGEISLVTGTTLTISGVISGEGGVTFSGVDDFPGGTVVFSSANTYEGGTVFTAGRLRISTDSNLGATTSNLFFNGENVAPILEISGTFSSGRDIRIEGIGAVFDIDDGEVVDFTGSVRMSSGQPVLKKIGGGSLSIQPSLSDVFSQLTVTIEEGNLTGNTHFLANSSFEIAEGATLTFDESALSTRGFYYGSNAGVTLEGKGSLIIDGGQLAFLVPIAAESQLGSTFEGGATLKRGTLIISADKFLPYTGTSTKIPIYQYVLGELNAAVTCEGGTLQTSLISGLSTNTVISDRPFILSADTIFNTVGNTTLELHGSVTGSGELTKEGEGTLALYFSNGITGDIVLGDGTVAVGVSSALGSGEIQAIGGALSSVSTATLNNLISLSVNTIFNTDANTALTLSGVISGDGELIKDGQGTLILTGEESYSGGTLVVEGTLTVNGTVPGVITVESEGHLNGTGLADADVIVAGSSSGGNSIGVLTVSGDMLYLTFRTKQHDSEILNFR